MRVLNNQPTIKPGPSNTIKLAIWARQVFLPRGLFKALKCKIVQLGFCAFVNPLKSLLRAFCNCGPVAQPGRALDSLKLKAFWKVLLLRSFSRLDVTGRRPR